MLGPTISASRSVRFPIEPADSQPGTYSLRPVPEPGRHWCQCKASEAPLGRSPFGDPPRRELFQALEHSGMAERNGNLHILPTGRRSSPFPDVAGIGRV